MTLGDNIRAARQKAGYTSQEDAAQALGVRMMSWNRWETGWTEPSVSRLIEIAKLLGTTVSKLTKGI